MINGLSEIQFAIIIVGIALLLAAVVLAILYATWRRAAYDFREAQRKRSELASEFKAVFGLPQD